MDHFNGLSPAEAERLAMLAEECGEVIHIVGKILRHGYDSYHPADPTVTNRDLLGRELTDLLAGNGDDVILLEQQHDGLLALGAGYSVSNQLAQIPFTVAPGTYRLFVLADSGNVVFEDAYESNNASAPRTVTVSRRTADLARRIRVCRAYDFRWIYTR